MSDIPVDGMTRVMLVNSIANPAAPTVAEIGAGIVVQEIMTSDGLVGFEAATADVPNGGLGSTVDTNTVGRDSYSGTLLRMKKQDGVDTVFDTYVKGTRTNVVVRRYVARNTAIAAGDKVSVFPVICGQTRELTPEPNTLARYEIPTTVESDPELRATVAP